jgi:hypothetical protein
MPKHIQIMLSLALVILVAGCGMPRINTTMLTPDDVTRMTDKMAQSIVRTPAVAKRTAASPRWIVSFDKVTNLTMHVMEEREQWRTMARFRALLSATRLRTERNFHFILPPEEWELYSGENAYADPMFRAKPTHSLQATFRTDTSQSMQHRADTYLCAFQLLRLSDGEILWEDAYEVKYTVEKNRFD